MVYSGRYIFKMDENWGYPYDSGNHHIEAVYMMVSPWLQSCNMITCRYIDILLHKYKKPASESQGLVQTIFQTLDRLHKIQMIMHAPRSKAIFLGFAFTWFLSRKWACCTSTHDFPVRAGHRHIEAQISFNFNHPIGEIHFSDAAPWCRKHQMKQ